MQWKPRAIDLAASGSALEMDLLWTRRALQQDKLYRDSADLRLQIIQAEGVRRRDSGSPHEAVSSLYPIHPVNAP